MSLSGYLKKRSMAFAKVSDERCQHGLRWEHFCEICDKPPNASPYCCHKCFKASGVLFLTRMLLCPNCGNKRCPKASDHQFACTGSNDPGQPGSVFANQI